MKQIKEQCTAKKPTQLLSGEGREDQERFLHVKPDL